MAQTTDTLWVVQNMRYPFHTHAKRHYRDRKTICGRTLSGENWCGPALLNLDMISCNQCERIIAKEQAHGQ